MNYLPRNRSRTGQYRILIFLLGVFAVGGLVFLFLNGAILSLILPMWKSENAATARFSGITGFFQTQGALVRENESLKSHISTLEAELANRSGLAVEESAVLTKLGRGQVTQGIAASVLVRPPKTAYDLLIIDAGSSDGVVSGVQVLLPEGPVLGRVEEVYRNSAKVKLLSSPGEKTSAVLERTGSAVELEGIGGGSFRISVPREEVVVVGDRVLTADISSNFVGTVEKVSLEQTDAFKEVWVQGTVNLFNIRLVVVK